MRRWVFRILGIVVAIALFDFLISFYQITNLRAENPKTTAFIQQYQSECQPACRISQTWKPLSSISPYLRKTVLISEDATFYQHDGIDPKAIRESWNANLKKKKIARGGSTITQQLVKNLYLSSSKNPIRKLKEILLALWMDKVLSKSRILEIYLNVIEWGKGVYGAEAASQYYFKKPARELDLGEAAYLVAIIPNPKLYTQAAYARRAERRKRIILQRM